MVVKPKRRIPTIKSSAPVAQNAIISSMAQQTAQANQPVQANPVVPKLLKTRTINLWMGSIEWWPVRNVATRQQPVKVVEPPKPSTNFNDMDVWGLQDELTRIKFRQQTGKFTEDDAVNFNRLTRALQDKTMQQNTTFEDDSISQLEAQREAERLRLEESNMSEMDAFRKQQEALRDQRIADIQKSWANTREAAQTATSFSGFGRSTFNAQQQADIEETTQRSILAAQAAADMEIQRREAELRWASGEILAQYDEQIAQAKGNAASIQQELNAKAAKINQEQSAVFGQTFKELVANSGINIDPNDEKALEQIIRIARNPDWSINEEVLNSLPEQFRPLIRWWVMSGIWAPQIDWTKVKFQRIGGTTKAPIYGYIDPVTWEVKQASAWQMQILRSWGWWGWVRGWIWGLWSSGIVGWSPEEMWFDPTLADIYKTINEWKSIDMERFTRMYWKSATQLQSEARAWKQSVIWQDISVALDTIDTLKNSYPWRASLLTSNNFTRALNPGLADYMSQYNYIKDNLTMEKLVSLKNSGATFGALSDSERVAIGNAANAISPDMSKNEFLKQLGIIEDTFKRSTLWKDPRKNTPATITPSTQSGTPNVQNMIQNFDTIKKQAPNAQAVYSLFWIK